MNISQFIRTIRRVRRTTTNGVCALLVTTLTATAMTLTLAGGSSSATAARFAVVAPDGDDHGNGRLVGLGDDHGNGHLVGLGDDHGN